MPNVLTTDKRGDPPQPATGFFEFVEGRKAPRLENLRFAVLALGDSTYEYFCEAGKRLDRRLEELGAKRLLERVDCDIDYDDAAAAWTTAVVEHLASEAAATPVSVAAATGETVPATVHDKRNPFSDHVIPKTRAYHEIWYGDERVASSAPEELFYGRTYMPRKFKIGFALPPSNDIDVYAQDLGFIAIGGEGGLEGFNVVIGGGMGRTDQAPETYPRLASLIGFVPADRVIACADAVMTVQRDYGDRKDRQRARFKYTIDDKGLDWVKAEIERVMGASFEEARRFSFASNGDTFGWQETPDGRFHRTIFVENGFYFDTRLLDAFRDVARIHRGTFRMTPNQNVIIAGVWAEDRAAIEALLAEHWPDGSEASTLRRNAIACVALPTCGLAMAESERYLPSLLGRIEAILAAHGLSEEPITIRMSGCPNGCSRPYIAEIGLTGRAPGKYNLYLGGGFHGDRLNRMIRENVGEAVILEVLDEVLGRYAREREPGERLGDFTIRAGIVREVTEGHLFND